jgi:hypothetical protein
VDATVTGSVPDSINAQTGQANTMATKYIGTRQLLQTVEFLTASTGVSTSAEHADDGIKSCYRRLQSLRETNRIIKMPTWFGFW